MDKLSDLPVKETQQTEQENAVLKKYFGDGQPEANERPTWMMTFKLALYTAVIFLMLCNPMADAIFCKLPYCGEGVVTLLASKTLIFMILFISMYKFLI